MHGSSAPRTILSSPTRSMGLQHILPIASKSLHHPSVCQRQPCICTALLMIHLSFTAQCIKQDKNTSLQLIFHLNLHLKHENGCQLLTPRNEMLCSALHTPRMSHQDLVRCFYKDPDSCNECFQPGRLPQSAKSSHRYLLPSLYNLQLTLTSEKILLHKLTSFKRNKNFI